MCHAHKNKWEKNNSRIRTTKIGSIGTLREYEKLLVFWNIGSRQDQTSGDKRKSKKREPQKNKKILKPSSTTEIWNEMKWNFLSMRKTLITVASRSDCNRTNTKTTKIKNQKWEEQRLYGYSKRQTGNCIQENRDMVTKEKPFHRNRFFLLQKYKITALGPMIFKWKLKICNRIACVGYVEMKIRWLENNQQMQQTCIKLIRDWMVKVIH